MCKIRKKNDKIWDNKPKEELVAEVRQKMEELNVNQSNLTFDKIIPKGRGTPFLKLTFLMASERRNATGLLNSIKQETGYIISPVEPRECQSWLPQYKTGIRNIIMGSFIEKGYEVTPDDFFIQMQWRFTPVFRFVWRVKILCYNFNEVLETDNIFGQIPDLGKQVRNDSDESNPTIDVTDINKENIVADIKRLMGSDQEGFSPTEESTAKEAELLTLSVKLVQRVIRLSKGFQNNERKIRKVRVSTSNSASLAPLRETYRVYKEQVAEGLKPEGYYSKPIKAYKVISSMLWKGKLTGS